MLSRGRQNMCKRLWHTPKISQTFAGEWNLVCSAMAGTKTALGIIRLWFNYFAASFFKALGNVNVNHLKIPKKHRGLHKRSSRATCGPRVWDPWFWRFWPVYFQRWNEGMWNACAKRLGGLAVTTSPGASRSFDPTLLKSMLFLWLQHQIWCLGNHLIFDGLTNFMLKRIWCSSEGNYDDFYL